MLWKPWMSYEKLKHIPLPKQNSQSAHIWGWGGREGDRAVRRPVRLHAAQCGECAVYRNPVQGTAKPGLLPTMHHSPHVIFSYVFVNIICLCVCAFRLVTDTWWTPLYRKRPVLWPVSWSQSHTKEWSHVSGRWEEEVWTRRASLRWQRSDYFFPQ